MKKSVRRPSKIDTEAMKEANISLTIIVIILLLLLTIATITIINPNIIDLIKARIIDIFK